MRSRYSLGLALFTGLSSLLTLLGCQGLRSQPQGSSTTGNLQSLNHIIIFAQENRSLDHYFGAMRQYWAQNGIADQSFDGLPQFNPASGATPLQGPASSNSGLRSRHPFPAIDCVASP